MKKIKFLLIPLFFLLGVIFLFSVVQATIVFPCPSGTTRSIRLDNSLGNSSLFSTVKNYFDVSPKLSTTGFCILDSRASIQLASDSNSYSSMKAVYYTKSKIDPNNKKNISGNATNLTINDFANTANKEYLINISGDLLLNASINVKNKSVIVIFVDGNLNINADQTYTDSGDRGLVFVVSGDVNIAPNVTEVDAVIITYRQFCSAVQVDGTCPSTPVETAFPLTIKGSVISLNDDGQTPKFVRSLANNNNPAETITYQPKYLIILRNIFAKTLTVWKEIQ